MFRFLLLLNVVVLLGASQVASASSCTRFDPLLAPRGGAALVDITILRGYTNEEGRELVDAHVNEDFTGQVGGDTLTVYGGPGLLDLGPRLSSLAIGTRLILPLGISSETGVGTPYICTAVVVVTSDEIDGYLRDYDCDFGLSVDRGCSGNHETMSLDRFRDIQRNYFAGTLQSRQRQVASAEANAPKFNLSTRVLSMPLVNLYETAAQQSRRDPPSGSIRASMRLLAGENGAITFEVLDVTPR